MPCSPSGCFGPRLWPYLLLVTRRGGGQQEVTGGGCRGVGTPVGLCTASPTRPPQLTGCPRLPAARERASGWAEPLLELGVVGKSFSCSVWTPGTRGSVHPEGRNRNLSPSRFLVSSWHGRLEITFSPRWSPWGPRGPAAPLLSPGNASRGQLGGREYSCVLPLPFLPLTLHPATTSCQTDLPTTAS